MAVVYGGQHHGLKKVLAPYYQFPHKCMFDTPRVLQIFSEFGFTASARTAFDSEIADIRAVELEDRATSAVVVEGRKQ